jgi:hypothetical protein
MASRKLFLGFASGLVSRFVSRNNDIRGYWGVGILSRDVHGTGGATVEFDLLKAHRRAHLSRSCDRNAHR